MKGIELRSSIILASMLILSASSAAAFGGAGSVVVDIVGSTVEDTSVVTDERSNIDLEIIGSTAKNTTVSPYIEKKFCPPVPVCPACPQCPVCPKPVCPDEYIYKEKMPWENRHLGVDAWYGAFWYNDRINLPKWPQI